MCALLVAAWTLLPEQLRQWAERRGSLQLGRPVTLQQLQVSLMPLRVTVQGLSIGEAGAHAASVSSSAPRSSEFLSLGRAEVELDPWSLWRGEPVVQRLQLDQLALRIERTAAGQWNFDDLKQRFTPATPAPAAQGTPPVFTLQQVALHAGRLSFDDGLRSGRHDIRDVELDLPWLSTHPHDAQREATARLSLKLNGAAVSLQAQARLFRPQPSVRAQLEVADLALAPLWPWWPPDLPLRPQEGFLDLKWTTVADQGPAGAWNLAVSGATALKDMGLHHPNGSPMASFKRLDVALQDVRPLQGLIHLGAVRLQGAEIHVRRDSRGQLEWAGLAGGEAPAPGGPVSPGPQAMGSGPAAWQWRTGPIAVDGLQILWSDRAVQPAVQARVSPLDLRVEGLSWPWDAPSAVELDARILPPARAGRAPAPAVAIGVRGRASLQEAQLTWRLGPVALAPWQPYIRSVLRPDLQGTLRAAGDLDWSSGVRPRLRAAVRSFRLEDFKALQAGAEPSPVSWRLLALDGVQADLLARRVVVSQWALQDPVLGIRRSRDGSVGLQGLGALADLLVPAATPPSAPPAALAPSRPTWRAELQRLRISGGRLDFTDELVASDAERGPWAMRLRSVMLHADGLAWPPGPAPAPLRLVMQWPQDVASGEEPRPPASVSLEGRLRWDAPGFQGTGRVERWPLSHFQPQLALQGVELPVRLERAELGLEGPFGLQWGAQGLTTSGEVSVRLADVRVLARDAADELAAWNLLQVQGLKWQVLPGQPPRVDVGLVRLSDFFARLQITEAGRLNLQDVTAPRPGDAVAAVRVGAPAPSALASAPPQADPATRPAVAGSSPDPAAVWPLDLTVERTELVNGRVDFIDRFIRPNYAADLTELNGSMGRFQTGSTAMAPVELRGRAARTASLEIRGAVNPTASPLMMDLSARATDLELAPLSAYGGKYVGYAIERGKLSVDLSYRIDADGKLEARNQVILNQLTFGERVESPQATSLPVRLALALLADRHGVVDVNLPISGSINEPQFSIMGLVWKMIGNLLLKVVTAPFAWLSGSGTQDLSVVPFESGAAGLGAAAQQALDKVHQALADRPSLRLTLTGQADAQAEQAALREAGLQERLSALMRREAARAEAVSTNGLPLPARGSPAYAGLVRRLYDETPLPDKPRNLLGRAAGVPVPDMEARLLAAMPAGEGTVRELALRRALAVRDALIARGLSAQRLFLAAPEVGQAAPADQSPPPAPAGPQPSPLGLIGSQVRMTITGP